MITTKEKGREKRLRNAETRRRKSINVDEGRKMMDEKDI